MHTNISGLTLDILLALAAGPNHAYGLVDQIRSDVQGADFIAERSVYRAIERMLEAGLIEQVELSPKVTLKRYKLTSFGRRILVSERARATRRLDLMKQRL